MSDIRGQVRAALQGAVPGFDTLDADTKETMVSLWTTAAEAWLRDAQDGVADRIERMIDDAFPAALRPSQRVGVEIERDFGSLRMRLTQEAFCRPTRAAVAAAYDELWDTLDAEFQRYAAERLHRPTIAAASAPAATELMDVDTIVCETRNGKAYYKVRGGEWSRYGVYVWPEVLAAAGFDPAEIRRLGEITPPNGTTADIAMKGDKPQKVVRIHVP